MQRFWDIVFSVITIILLSPVFIVTIIILRLTGEGEIFFSQSRIGMHGKEIKIFKFSTMLKNSPNTGAGTVTLKNDPRVLPFGKLLRKSKINELPQIFNILFGDMSIIGPRPQTKRCFDAFPLASQETIIQVRPGLSGVGSIYFRNEEDMLDDEDNADIFYNDVIMPFKGKLEEWYVENQSIWLYFVLIAATILVVIDGKIPFKNNIFLSLPTYPESLEKYF